MFQIYNSYTNKKEIFKPITEGKVKIYSCGPTVYNYAHVANFSSFLMGDILVRYLRYKGNKVTWISNITDVGHLTDDDNGDDGDDRMELAAKKENKTPIEVARFYEKVFMDDIKKLNLTKADKYPRATEHIDEMIEIIESLVKKGFTYETSDGIYFDISKFPKYGELSGNKLESLVAGSRVEVNEEKRSPFDFALWKKLVGKNENHSMKWDSPWGTGFPGWHIECSAMSRKYLGDTLDFHTGGEDNKFPHHESEIAQSESFTGKTYSNYWLHKSHIMINSEKMSKSLGNFFTVSDLVEKGYNPLAIRFTLISTHYRSKLNLTLEAIEASDKTIFKFNDFIQKLLGLNESNKIDTIEKNCNSINSIIKSTKQQFEKALDDDLNISSALASFFGFIKSINKQINKNNVSSEIANNILKFVKEIDSVFGVMNFEKREEKKITSDDKKKIDDLLLFRDKFRTEKNWVEADKIRDMLNEMGVKIADK